MSLDLPNGFYRVSIKALLRDKTGTKFAVVKEGNVWELPGGGMKWGESPRECLVRELREELNLKVTSVGNCAVHLLTGKNRKGNWSVCLVYLVQVQNFNYTPTPECQEMRFVTPAEALVLEGAFRTVSELAAKL